MNKRVFCISAVYLFFLFSGSALSCFASPESPGQVRFAVGEKTISLGGAFTWNLAEFRAGITEAGAVRSNPVLLLSSGANAADLRGKASGSLAGSSVSTLDFSLAFDEGRAAHFSDSAGNYRVKVPPSLETVDRRFARTGAGAALFSGEPIEIEPQNKNALFAPGSHIRDFSIAFWLYPLNLENGEEIFAWTASQPLPKNAAGGYVYQRIQCISSKNRLQWTFHNFFASPDELKYLEILVAGDSPVVPKSWSHHLVRFDSGTGMLEYLVNGKTEAIVYASAS
jgi:hypothetical protein